MKIKNLVSGLLFATCAALSVPGHAVMLFSDNFDADHAGTVLNASLSNWTVSNGTVDYLGTPSGYSISCYGGTGGCLDMDGSTSPSDAGRITSIATFNLSGGAFYHIQAQISGNQRSGGPDEIMFGLADAAGVPIPAYSGTFGPIDWNSPFGSYSLGIAPTSDMTSRLFFEGTGGDNEGVILDNVMFCQGVDHETCHGTVPEPATLALFGLGLTGFAFARRRKQ